MDDAGRMRGDERRRYLRDDFEGIVQFQTALSKASAQCRPIDELAGDVVIALELSDFENGEDIGMIQSGGSAGFLLKSANQFLIVGGVGGQELQGDLASKPDIEREIDLTHSSRPDAAQDTVVAEGLANARILGLRNSCRL